MNILLSSLTALGIALAQPSASNPPAMTEISHPEAQSLEHTIARYHRGFSEGDAELILSALSDQFIIYNGNYSDDPNQWQAHFFLEGDNLRNWADFMIREAGPHQNSFKTTHIHVRSNGAVVVTEDTGSNKFRTWDQEQVTWLLGKRSEGWKIVGMFIRDIRNP